MMTVANTPEVTNNPEKYEQLLSAAAELNPADYFTLGWYFANRNLDDKAAAAYEKGNTLCPDSVLASYYAGWLVHYYLKKGETDKARAVADNAGEVYSATGLEAKAGFFEETGDYNSAFEWYAKVEERYNDVGPLLTFMIRYKDKTRDTRFDGELQKRITSLFPRGVEKVKLEDFKSPPTDGVVFTSSSDILQSAGLHKGDVIVAVYGIRIYDRFQYSYGRDLYATPELDLIVWIQNEHTYREIKSSPPRHMFGTTINTYHP